MFVLNALGTTYLWFLTIEYADRGMNRKAKVGTYMTAALGGCSSLCLVLALRQLST
ncbi:mitogen activated protein kinase kinase kinase 2 [Ahrensia sp. R2A130]|nr:mitogen activated protein kinase kinase kinase 2 [Ahrensia sp. R2A130]